MSDYTQLLNLYAFSLGQAKKLTADLPADKWAFQPAPHTNHAAWVIGHLACTGNVLAALIGDEFRCPEAWHGKFGIFSEPVNDAAAYPAPAALIESLEEVHQRLTRVVPTVSQEVWDGRPNNERIAEHFPVLGSFATLILGAHESFHLGQLSTWRRVQGLPRV